MFGTPVSTSIHCPTHIADMIVVSAKKAKIQRRHVRSLSVQVSLSSIKPQSGQHRIRKVDQNSKQQFFGPSTIPCNFETAMAKRELGLASRSLI